VIYDVILPLEAVEDVLRITMASQSKSSIINASRQFQESLKTNPAEAIATARRQRLFCYAAFFGACCWARRIPHILTTS